MASQANGLGLFAELPPEIRAEIWTLTLITDRPIKIDRHKNESPSRKWYDAYLLSSKLDTLGHQVFPSVNLIRASKALNIEAAPVLYYNNRFIFPDTHVLETFFDKIGEMAFSLADLEVRRIRLDTEADQLAVLRRMETPRRIVLSISTGHTANSARSASRAALTTWTWIKPIVVRNGTGYMLNKSLRPYNYSEILPDRTPAWKYKPGSKEEQRKRLEAFEFVVDEKVEFKTDSGIRRVQNADERAMLFKAKVRQWW